MVTRKTSGKRPVRKLKLKKETLKDLGPKGGAVKGGVRANTWTCGDSCRRCETDSCLC